MIRAIQSTSFMSSVLVAWSGLKEASSSVFDGLALHDLGHHLAIGGAHHHAVALAHRGAGETMMVSPSR